VHLDDVAALTFDMFGTVVDWRGSIARELAASSARAVWSATGLSSPMCPDARVRFATQLPARNLAIVAGL
jgi:hypothetical protein